MKWGGDLLVAWVVSVSISGAGIAGWDSSPDSEGGIKEEAWQDSWLVSLMDRFIYGTTGILEKGIGSCQSRGSRTVLRGSTCFWCWWFVLTRMLHGLGIELLCAQTRVQCHCSRSRSTREKKKVCTILRRNVDFWWVYHTSLSTFRSFFFGMSHDFLPASIGWLRLLFWSLRCIPEKGEGGLGYSSRFWPVLWVVGCLLDCIGY